MAAVIGVYGTPYKLTAEVTSVLRRLKPADIITPVPA